MIYAEKLPKNTYEGSSAVQGKKMWLRQAANAKRERFIAFQGNQRISSDLIQPNCVLPLMLPETKSPSGGRLQFPKYQSNIILQYTR